jgi:nucleoid-associated protein YgaU
MRIIATLGLLMLILTGAVFIKTQTNTETNAPPKEYPNSPEIGTLTLGIETENETYQETIDSSEITLPGNQEVKSQESKNLKTIGNTQTEIKESAPVDVNYTVVAGDTMYGIIKTTYGVFSEEILKQIAIKNNLDNPNNLSIGDIIKLPTVLLETASGVPQELKPKQ